MATLTAQSTKTRTGKQINYVPATSGGDRAAPARDAYLLVRNGSGASINVTLDAVTKSFNGANIPDTVIAVPAGKDVFIPLRSEYASPTDGLVGIAYSAVTTVTVAVIQA